MGMFDSVWVKCPYCGDRVEFQSKAGQCLCNHYVINNVPAPIAADIIGAVETCDNCKNNVVLKGTFSIVLHPDKTN